MNCFSCSRRTLSLFIRSFTIENRTPLVRRSPLRISPKPQPFSTARRLRIAKPVSEDLQTPKHASEPKDAASPKVRRARRNSIEVRGRDTKDDTAVNPSPPPKKKKESWMIQKAAVKEKLGDQAWNPRKKLSPDAMEGIRHLHRTQPEKFTTPILAEYFKVSPEAIRRILKSKWRPSDEEQDERLKRWDKRGERIWSNLVELGVKPPKKWREMGVGRARKGEVPSWKGRWRNRVLVNDSVRDDVIPIVDKVTEEKETRWQETPIASRMF